MSSDGIVGKVVKLFCVLILARCICSYTYETVLEYFDMSKIFKELNRELLSLKQHSANLGWNAAYSRDNRNLTDELAQLANFKANWTNTVCGMEGKVARNEVEKRQIFLLCRGARYTQQQASQLAIILEKLSRTYCSTVICIKAKNKYKLCLKGELDFEILIKNPNLNEGHLLWAWKAWHNNVGPKIRKHYPELVSLLNTGAVQNGYNDFGEVWEDELEIPNFELYIKMLFKKIQPMYLLLHAVVRHKLVEKYGEDIVDPTGTIPAHLLGSMCAQDWSSLVYLFFNKTHFDLEENLSKKPWTIKYMVSLVEDFFTSIGFPKLPEKFWKRSRIENKNISFCHGSATNMFAPDDFRVSICADLNMGDLSIILHEVGHIQYYMAYQEQPTLFQEAANSAFDESIGAAISLSFFSPQHLHRIGLITTDQLYNTELRFDEILLFYLALSKIPMIPYAFMMDLYRWNIFHGQTTPNNYNTAFWEVNESIRGIKAPVRREKSNFDAGAQFHVANNIPYLRYFLSAFIQADIFKTLCQKAVFESDAEKGEIPFPLHHCDIYGSNKAGKALKEFLSMGASQIWTRSYKIFTGSKTIDFNSLLEYFDPVYDWLYEYVKVNNIPVGW